MLTEATFTMYTPTQPSKSYQHVVLIDDDPINNLICEGMLRLTGSARRISSFLNARDALAWLRDQPPEAWPALILLDINMPGMNGWDFLDALATLERVPPVSIKILSSSVSPADRARAASYAQVDDYLVKPLSCEQLRPALPQLSLA